MRDDTVRDVMIKVFEKSFFLCTADTSYVLNITDEGWPEHLYYGKRIDEGTDPKETVRALSGKVSHPKGTTINYRKDSLTMLEDTMLEISSMGKGDLRTPFIVLEYADGSVTSDFLFESYSLNDEAVFPKGLAHSVYGDRKGEQLEIVFKEKEKDVWLKLFYTVYEECNVITRWCRVENRSEEVVNIKRIMSTQLDLDRNDYKMITFGGNWAREMEKHETVLTHGLFENSTYSGISSNRCNPFVMLTNVSAGETSGEGYGLNLIYSGNHYEAAEVSGFYKTRFVSGINPIDFAWKLEAKDSFDAPEAVMTFSDKGYRGISFNMHDFVREHIVRSKFKSSPRPLLINSWEAAYFNINESKLLALAGKAADAGMELFVMDDGWFKGRNDDTSSLGDWTVELKKLPNGISGLAEKIHKLGLQFGIWVEPEMVNEDSDLYRAHPEYAMSIPGRENSLGRNQMLLDLTNPEVIEYVKDSMRAVFKDNGVDYVKWDMNRMFSDVYSKVLPADRQRETAHRYVLGLYDIMETLTSEFPDILFEGCASGGNRFDLGILNYMPQIWASDDTDAIMRTHIQEGYSYGYPMSTVTAHVSACPNHQTLRNTPLDTRFNIAAFGLLGYELNLCELGKEELDAIRVQTSLYKAWRDVLQYGDFYRVSKYEWVTVSKDKRRAVAVTWNELMTPNDQYGVLRTAGLDDELIYHVFNIRLRHDLREFGDLVNQVSPIHIKKGSVLHNLLAKFVKLDGELEDYTVTGSVLNNAGVKLKQAYGGTGFNAETRLFQDFASRMYFIEAKDMTVEMALNVR